MQLNAGAEGSSEREQISTLLQRSAAFDQDAVRRAHSRSNLPHQERGQAAGNNSNDPPSKIANDVE